MSTETMKPFEALDDWDEGDPCPVHDTPYKKSYTFGSSMTGEADVWTFRGCQCAVSVTHDPCGHFGSTAVHHATYAEASGRATMHKMVCADKYGGF